jgi:hypothetical protein
MDTPIAAILWHEGQQRDVAGLLRLLQHVESACVELGADDAAGLLAEAQERLAAVAGRRALAA